MKLSEKTKTIIGGFVIIALFILSSYLVRQNIEFVKSLISNDFVGIIIFIVIIIIGMIIAPISSVPLIPIASNLWGVSLTVIILIFGWTLGSVIVFFIARRFGAPLVKKLFSFEKIKKIESKIPKENLLLDLILLRIIIPIDILSYALGLFSSVSLRLFLLASLIGAIPLALAFSYLGTIPILYQLLGFFIIGFVIVLIQEFRNKRSAIK